MQLNLFRAYQEAFKHHLQTRAAERYAFIYESQRVFQENWDLTATDFAEMYQRSLQNSQNRRLWRAEHYHPKDTLAKLLTENPDYGRHAFNDLFNNDKDLAGRCQRFRYYLDELLRLHQEARPATKENTHFHDDHRMTFLYLTFRHPEVYAPYHFTDFVDFLKKVRAKTPPRSHDPERFGKATKVMFTLLYKDEDLVTAHRNRLRPERDYLDTSGILCYEFYRFVAQNDLPA